MDCTNKKEIRVVYGDYTLGVHGEGYDYIFSYAQGGLESIVKNGYEWLYRCPKPTFWRALTDNDRGSKFQIKSGSWLAADMFMLDMGKEEVKEALDMDENLIREALNLILVRDQMLEAFGTLID